MTVPTDSLPDDPDTLKAMLLAERTRAERLEQIIKEMQRHRFGRRAETLPEDQLDHHAHRARRADHVPAFTARSTAATVFASAPRPTRMVTPSISTSMIPPI